MGLCIGLFAVYNRSEISLDWGVFLCPWLFFLMGLISELGVHLLLFNSLMQEHLSMPFRQPRQRTLIHVLKGRHSLIFEFEFNVN